MSTSNRTSSRDSRFTSAPAAERTGSRSVDEGEEYRIPSSDSAAREQIAGIDAQTEAMRPGFDQHFSVTNFPERGQRYSRDRKQQPPSRDRDQAPALGTLAHERKHADAQGAAMVERAMADKSFRSRVAAAQVHGELMANPHAAVVTHLPEDRAGSRDQIRQEVDRLYKNQSAQSMGRFIRVFEEQDGKRVDVEPPKAIAQDREKLVDWIADQAAAGKGLSMRSREMATVASVAATLSEDRAGVHFARQGMDPKHLELAGGIEQTGKELLGLNGAQNKAVLTEGRPEGGERVVGRSDLLEKLRTFGERLDAERPGDLAPDSTFGQFMSAARGKVQEAEIGLFSDVVYPNGKHAVTLEIPVPKPAVQTVGEQPILPETKEVTIEVESSPAKAAPTSVPTSAPAERAEVAPSIASAPTGAVESSAADSSKQESTARQDAGQVFRQLESLPREVTHLGRIEAPDAMVEVMTLANKSRLTGRLELAGENRAKVWFAAGEISDIQAEGGKNDTAIESLAVGKFQSYAFHAESQAKAPKPEAPMNFTSVVMEMARVQDERQRVTIEERRGSTAQLVAQANAEATRGVVEAQS